MDETFKVGDSSGPVVAGLLTKGVITERTKLLIGVWIVFINEYPKKTWQDQVIQEEYVFDDM